MKIRSISFIRILVFSLILLSFTSATYAQTPTPDTSAITADQVNEVARGLWCPLCSGVRLDACELKACEQMKDMIAIKLAEGASEEEIRDYFAEQYGPQVYGQPPTEGFNWLAWILPVLGLVGGGLFVWYGIRRMIRPQSASDPSGAETAGAQTAAQADDYSQKLEQELSRYD